jgi:ankyrin repeat protein
MDLPPPQDNDIIITQFKPVNGQWELNDDYIKYIDPPDETILHNYCQYGINSTPIAVFKFLVETKGCDINAQDKSANTPLHYALIYFNPNNGGDVAVLTYLLTHNNVNVNIMDQYRNTLFHRICANINKLPLAVFKHFIEIKCCDVNLQDKYDNTPIYYALEHFNHGSDVNILTYLLTRNDINVNIKTLQGYTLLHECCLNINKLSLVVFKFLIETKGCDINAQDKNNNIPIHFAINYFNPNNGGDIAVLTYLIGHNSCNAHIKNQHGYTPLQLMCIRNFSDSEDYDDSEDDSEDDLEDVVRLQIEADTFWCQIVEIITGTYIQYLFDETAL